MTIATQWHGLDTVFISECCEFISSRYDVLVTCPDLTRIDRVDGQINNNKNLFIAHLKRKYIEWLKNVTPTGGLTAKTAISTKITFKCRKQQNEIDGVYIFIHKRQFISCSAPLAKTIFYIRYRQQKIKYIHMGKNSSNL